MVGCQLIKQDKPVDLVQLLWISALLFTINAQAQSYDLLIRNGQVIDPKNNIEAKMDVAIRDGKIVKVAGSIPSSQASKIIDATGLIVSPGLIDMHTHVF